MRKIAVQTGVAAGTTVWNGYVGGETHCNAPAEPGFYTLYELDWAEIEKIEISVYEKAAM